MSFSTFFARTLKDPSYLGRRFAWEILKRLPERELISNTRHGRMAYSSRDLAIGQSLFLARECDYADLVNVQKILIQEGLAHEKGNGTLIDIGANIGTVCIPMLRTEFVQRAFAFEPEPRNVAHLEKNRKINQLEGKLEIYPIGLSSVSGEHPLLLCATNHGDHRVDLSGKNRVLFNVEPARKSLHVTVRTLDEVIDEAKLSLEDIQLIWMDTQGHEPEILKGAQKILKASRPLVLEFWPEMLRLHSEETVKEHFKRIQTHYRRFYNLQDPSAGPQPIDRLPELLGMELHGDIFTFTDVLLLA